VVAKKHCLGEISKYYIKLHSLHSTTRPFRHLKGASVYRPSQITHNIKLSYHLSLFKLNRSSDKMNNILSCIIDKITKYKTTK